jgi:poly(A) polymerase
MFSRNVWRQVKKQWDHADGPVSVIVKRKNHALSRKQISPNALKALYRLKQAGFDAFLVGGGVRDILLKKPTKDFDIVTNALPEEVRKLFSNSRIIGRRFKLVHILFHKEIIECSTFRADGGDDQSSVSSRRQSIDGESEVNLNKPELRHDNVYGSIEQDAWRRDFTVNSLYYNIKDFSIIDYTGGIVDLRAKVMRIIGDPMQRFEEDPVRLLRAVRLSAKLKFSMHPDTDAVVKTQQDLLDNVPPSRIFHEFMKLFFSGYAVLTYEQMMGYGYMEKLFPELAVALRHRICPSHEKVIKLALKATDVRFKENKTINPGFLVAVFLWPVVCYHNEALKAEESREHARFMLAVDLAIAGSSQLMNLPNRMKQMIRSMWRMQKHLENPRPRRVDGLYGQRYFRASYDFLLLRAEAGEIRYRWSSWWRNYQKATTKVRLKMLTKINNNK